MLNQLNYNPYAMDPQGLQLLQLNRLNEFDALVREAELEMEALDYEEYTDMEDLDYSEGETEEEPSKK